jgi:hypothetical protein
LKNKNKWSYKKKKIKNIFNKEIYRLEQLIEKDIVYLKGKRKKRKVQN